MPEIKSLNLYMDESGKFESNTDKKIIAGILVPENNSQIITDLRAIFGDEPDFNKFHATAFFNDKEKDLITQQDFIHKIINFLRKYDLITFSISHKEDLNLSTSFSEKELANRHLLMVNILFEYLIYLNPDFWGQEIHFSLYPNSRTLKTTDESKHHYEKLGYHIQSKKNESENGMQEKKLVYVFDSDFVRHTLLNNSVFYSQYESKIGIRKIKDIKVESHNHSKNHFVYLVDHIAYLLYKNGKFNNTKLNSIVLELNPLIKIKLKYDNEYKEFRELILSYLNEDIALFYQNTFRLLKNLRNSYISQILHKLLEKNNINLNKIKNLDELESLVDYYISNSYGNWEYVSMIIDKFINFVKEKNNHKLLKKFYNHKIRILNHRGNYYSSIKYYNDLKNLDIESINEIIDKIETENRYAVALCNVFDFKTAIKKLTFYYNYLIERKKITENLINKELNDELLCKVAGTLGQCHAFLSMKDNNNFEIAKNYFIIAKKNLNEHDNLIRQNINLYHLYHDWYKIDINNKNELDSYINELMRSKKVDEFLEKFPIPSLKMQFIFHCVLKYIYTFLINTDLCKAIRKKCTIKNITNSFGDAANEHPFQFIYMYLALINLHFKKNDDAEKYFNQSINLSKKFSSNEEAPIFKAIEAFIYAQYAKKYFEVEKKIKIDHIQKAILNLEEIGKNPNNNKMLELDEKLVARSGWFMDAYNSLRETDYQNNFDIAKLDVFLNCFTFNYY